MPSFKLPTGAKPEETKSGFEPYDGPAPTKRGMYRAVLKKVQLKKFKSGATGFYIVAELKAANGDPKGHAEFDGYPMFIQNIIIETKDGTPLKEGSVRNLNNFLAAIGAKPNLDSIVTGKGELEDGVDVTKIAGKNPVDSIVTIDVAIGEYNDEPRPESNGIYKSKEEDAKVSKPKYEAEPDEDEAEEDDDDLLEEGDEDEESEEDEDEEAEDEYDPEARADELRGEKLAALRALHTELGGDGKGTKVKLIEDIVEMEQEDPDEDPDSEEEEEDDEVEVEEDEAEEEEEEEAEEDEDDGRAEREAELTALDRTELKTILKAAQPDFKVFKSTTDAALVEAILDDEFSESTPF